MRKYFILRAIPRHEDPKIKLSQRRKELSRMFLKLAAQAAESDETYFMAVSNAEKLAVDVEKSLGKRFDLDFDSIYIGTYKKICHKNDQQQTTIHNYDPL